MYKPVEQRNFFEQETLTNPFGYYRDAHAEGVSIQHFAQTNTYVVYSYDLVSEATGRVEEFSNDFSSLMGADDAEIDAIMAQGWPNPPTLLTADAPIHTRFRKLVNLAFSMPRVNAIEGDVRREAVELIEGIADQGECEYQG